MTDCTFCGKPLQKGMGKMYVKKEGTIYFFCSNKCEKNLLKLGRNPRFVKWANLYHVEKRITKSGGKEKAKAEKQKAKNEKENGKKADEKNEKK